jgi:hypothetical protein
MVGFFALRPFFRARRDEALGVIVINAGAQIVIAGADLVAPWPAPHRRGSRAAHPSRATLRARPSDRFVAPGVSHRRGRSPRARPRHRAPCPSRSALHWTKESYRRNGRSMVHGVMKNPFASWSIYVSIGSWRVDEGRRERSGGLLHRMHALERGRIGCSPAH